MPQRESNAPTERIMRILDDVAELEDYCRVVEDLILSNFPDQVHLFPARPVLENVISEKARQSLMLEQTRRKREYARRVAQLGRDHSIDHAISMKDIKI